MEALNGITKENNDPENVNIKGNNIQSELDIQKGNLPDVETSSQNMNDQSKEANPGIWKQYTNNLFRIDFG